MRISDWSSDVCSSDLHAVAALAALPELKHAICIDAKIDGFSSLSDWFSEPRDVTLAFPIRQMEDAVAISSTGGTTGEPKGAIHTNRSFEAVVASVYALFQFDEPPVDRKSTSLNSRH